MIRFLTIQSTYDTTEYALYHGSTVTEYGALNKFDASSLLIPCLKELLHRNSCRLEDLDTIVVNRGPAPFTSLRTLITTINGIRFVYHTPLIGIDGFQTWFCMLPDTTHDTAIIMNAFNQEVYIGLRQAGSSTYRSWYGPIEQIICQIQASITTPVVIAGNALPIYRPLLEQKFQEKVLFNDINLMVNSLHFLALLGIQAWEKQQFSSVALTPLYLKTTA